MTASSIDVDIFAHVGLAVEVYSGYADSAGDDSRSKLLATVPGSG